MNGIIYSTKKDLRKIALCHRSAFPQSLSSKMGTKYLTKMIDWYLSDEKKFLFHIEDGDVCIGYCGGMISDGTQATGSASGMIQYSFNEAVKSFALRPWLLFNRELLTKYGLIIKNFKRKFSKKKNKKQKRVNENFESETGLVVIGVSNEYQGKGYGTILLKEFEKKTRQLNLKKMSLTVKSYNHKAIKSYESNGWIKEKLSGNSLEMAKYLN